MAITLDNSSATANGAAVSMTLALTIGATGKVLLVFAGNENTRSVSAMAWNGVAMTRLQGVANSSRLSELWCLTAPATGTHNLVTNWTGAGSMGMIALSYNAVKTSGGFGTSVAGSANASTNTNMSLSSTTTDIVVGYFAQNNGAGTFTTNGNLIKSLTVSATTMFIAACDLAGAAPVTLSCVSGTSSAWTFMGVPLVYSAPAATLLVGSMSMMGVGF